MTLLSTSLLIPLGVSEGQPEVSEAILLENFNYASVEEMEQAGWETLNIEIENGVVSTNLSRLENELPHERWATISHTIPKGDIIVETRVLFSGLPEYVWFRINVSGSQPPNAFFQSALLGQGWHTLAIELLGGGQRTYVDGTLVEQVELDYDDLRLEESVSLVLDFSPGT